MIERKYKLKRTKIVATIGPTSLSKKKIRKMILAGLNVCRINFSHCNHQNASNIISIVGELNTELNTHVAVMGDLQGPKLRIGKVSNDNLLEKNQLITVQYGDGNSDKNTIFVNYKSIANDVCVGEKILLDDGKILLKVRSIDGDKISCMIIQGGVISPNKGFNLPNTKISLPTLTEKDHADLLFCIKNNIEWIALSFVRTGNDITILKKIPEL